ncbi:MAG: copper transporter, partial [Actinomycetota bacterium]|nr:copper transporter [Actinomycetota bacterium]
MPDLRYHLISLISVFLALAVGVLLGVAMADGGVVTQGLRGQIEDVRERLDDQDREIVERNEEIATLTERAQEEQAVAERMSQVMISETLTNLNVTIVAGPFADADTTQSIQSAFDDAGSESISLTTLDEPDPAQVTGPEADPESLYIDEAVEILSEEGEGPPDIIVFVGGRDGAPDQEAYDTG